ncbi:protein RESTRICTED TEV MOVEMENT 2-like [Impatiens glandulifera]|uniref:protein RESTRICTED TEV MOVEMENT 2-like n=1 Tax=Impatiens glandulifera TaxID=253017 RepID=UPI001FB1032D|nr:protein RESTRICTED TEV MOVEMENT 2-like [Impatiens glandulifera]
MATRDYLNFEPVTQWVHENECDTLLVSLPDFSKEQLKVQISPSGTLKISGERPIGVNKWSRFSKEFPVSSNCDTTKLNANFSQGILYVKQPKLINPAEKGEKLENKPNVSNNEPPKYQKPKDDQEKSENKTSGSNEPPKSQKPKDDQLQKKTQESTELHKEGQPKPHKTDQVTGQTMTKPKNDQLTQIQKGAQELAQITNPMGKQKDQKQGNDYEDLPKKETVADEVPEKSSYNEEKKKEIVGNEKNESNYEEDEYEQAINRAMEVGQPSRWMILVLVVLFIALVGFQFMNGIIEGYHEWHQN